MDCCHRSGFFDELLAATRSCREFPLHHLQRDGSFQPAIFGLKHFAHATFAEYPNDSVRPQSPDFTLPLGRIKEFVLCFTGIHATESRF